MKVDNLELEPVLRRSTTTKLSEMLSTERDAKTSSAAPTHERVPLTPAPGLVADQSGAAKVVTRPRRRISSSADLTRVSPTLSEISQPSSAMLSELLKFFSLLDEIDRSTAVELERAA